MSGVERMTIERIQPKPKNNQPEKIHTNIRRADIWIADISGVDGSVQSGHNRPVIVIQNELGNKFAPTVIIAPLSTSITKAKIPTHVEILKSDGADRDSIALLEQVRVIDQWCLIEKVAHLSKEKMLEIDKALAISVGLHYLYE